MSGNCFARKAAIGKARCARCRSSWGGPWSPPEAEGRPRGAPLCVIKSPGFNYARAALGKTCPGLPPGTCVPPGSGPAAAGTAVALAARQRPAAPRRPAFPGRPPSARARGMPGGGASRFGSASRVGSAPFPLPPRAFPARPASGRRGERARAGRRGAAMVAARSCAPETPARPCGACTAAPRGPSRCWSWSSTAGKPRGGAPLGGAPSRHTKGSARRPASSSSSERGKRAAPGRCGAEASLCPQPSERRSARSCPQLSEPRLAACRRLGALLAANCARSQSSRGCHLVLSSCAGTHSRAGRARGSKGCAEGRASDWSRGSSH